MLKKIYNNLYILFILFLNTPFYFNIMPGIQKHFISLLLMCLFCIYLKRYSTIFIGNKICLQYLKLMALVYSLSIFFSIIIPLFYTTNDYSYSIFLVNNIIRIVKYQCVFFLLYKMRNTYDVFLLFLKLFVVATVIHVFSTIVFLFIPSFKDIWFSIIQYKEQERLERVTEYITRYGISGFSGFVHTHVCSLAVLFSIFLIINDNRKNSFLLFLYDNLFYWQFFLW
jgi:hypothetical protein